MTLTNLTSQLHNKLEPVAKRWLSPASLSKLATRMPHKFNTCVVEALCNKAFDEQLREGDFDFLQDRLLKIQLLDSALLVGLTLTQGKFHCLHFTQAEFSADATLAIKAADAISLLKQEVDPDTLFFQRKLKIAGDTELAHHVKNTIDTLDPKVIPQLLLKLASLYKQKILD